MRNNWLFFMDLDGRSPYMFPAEPPVPQSFGGHLVSQISLFVDNSLYSSRYLYVPGSLTLQEAFNYISKFAGALLFWFGGGTNSNISSNLSGNSRASNPTSCRSPVQAKHINCSRHKHLGFSFSSGAKGKSATPLDFGKISSFTARQLLSAAEELRSFPVVSLGAALVSPFNDVSAKALGVPLENSDMLTQRCMDKSPCEVKHHGCADISFPDVNWTVHAVEPRTGIEFPTILDNILEGEKNSSLMSEVLVGTGSRTMTIIKIKSLKVYAFGFYIHPYDVCVKLGPKYGSIPVGEVNNHDFYKDLLREDINMTVRLVVNCNGMKINTVRDAFEKSLRARLVKTNPDTDFNCLRTFGSLFAEDILLHTGTTIDFRQTADGHLITEIGGNQIGAVHSKELCRAFFDMYIGDVPVSEQTKEEIGRNVASIIRRC
ncbi:Fatty-acid-binding protein [Actinidia chinensis var. chinensis]|uniref:Fatty-acid-binding protein n=1 Tax=Actinidia chinensis var. chinensis TaxID=1590841 RepID=A0A2R6PMQ4_ACTCC|nr:Fatty-acid-binding protein [Actinidia chinensis var. chinensis]